MTIAAPLIVRRHEILLKPDPTRVLVRPFLPLPDPRSHNPNDVSRGVKIMARIMALPDDEVRGFLDDVIKDFGGRHQQLTDILEQRFEQARQFILTDRPIDENRRLLIGSYYTSEYSLESAALFNPSIVPHPDQSGVPANALKFVMSLRALGEGHISSITFREGLLTEEGEITITPPTRYVAEPKPVTMPSFERELFWRKLSEMGQAAPFVRQVLDSLPENFSFPELRTAAATARRLTPTADTQALSERMLLLAQSNYDVQFDPAQSMSERIIFPFSPSQANGIEDARFVRFVDDKGAVNYYATYTAWDGRVILPQLLETPDFLHFHVRTLIGAAVQNKGMALFPRKIGGQYVMLSRQDNENIHIMYSDHHHFWHESTVIMRPAEAWELVQLGNCGSPLETDAGWLVLSHGVGPMRKYCVSAFLLDKEDPSKVIGRLRTPLLRPDASTREGYVPNVVYTCGALIHRGQLILPYAIADTVTTFASVPVDELLSAMS
ncbi:MAG: glycoside hydrolase family 130 protein [Verrucomicrobiales bacterium]